MAALVKMKNNRGFTLVEIIVACVIVSIAMAFAAGILLTSFNLTSRSAAANESKMIGDTVYNWISDRLTYASNLQILNGQDTTTAAKYSNTLRIENGKLLVKMEGGTEYSLYGNDFYGNTEIRMTVQALDSNKVRLAVEVLDGDTVCYRTGSTIQILNIAVTGGSISGVTGTELTDPKLIYSTTDDSSTSVVS